MRKIVDIWRGTSNLASGGTVGVWGSRWIWDGIWHIRLRYENDKELPYLIGAEGDTWDILVEGGPPVCNLCGCHSHLAHDCFAPKRRDFLITRWDESMEGPVEIFFPLKEKTRSG